MYDSTLKVIQGMKTHKLRIAITSVKARMLHCWETATTR